MNQRKLVHALETATRGVMKHFLMAAVVSTGFLYPAEAGIIKADYEPALKMPFDLTMETALSAIPQIPPQIVTPPPAPKRYVPLTPKVVVASTRTVRISAYTSSPEETDDTPFETASGSRTRDGVVAANFLPFGTRIKIPSLYGNKIFVVEDRMHPRFNDSVDIWMETKAEAFRHGVRYAEIAILD